MQISITRLELELERQQAADLATEIFRQLAEDPTGRVALEFSIEPSGTVQVWEPAGSDDDD